MWISEDSEFGVLTLSRDSIEPTRNSGGLSPKMTGNLSEKSHSRENRGDAYRSHGGKSIDFFGSSSYTSIRRSDAFLVEITLIGREKRA